MTKYFIVIFSLLALGYLNASAHNHKHTHLNNKNPLLGIKHEDHEKKHHHHTEVHPFESFTRSAVVGVLSTCGVLYFQESNNTKACVGTIIWGGLAFLGLRGGLAFLGLHCLRNDPNLKVGFLGTGAGIALGAVLYKICI